MDGFANLKMTHPKLTSGKRYLTRQNRLPEVKGVCLQWLNMNTYGQPIVYMVKYVGVKSLIDLPLTANESLKIEAQG